MTLGKELFDMEQGFWLAGKEYFLDHVDDRCLLAFPQAGEMHGVFRALSPHPHQPFSFPHVSVLYFERAGKTR